MHLQVLSDAVVELLSYLLTNTYTLYKISNSIDVSLKHEKNIIVDMNIHAWGKIAVSIANDNSWRTMERDACSRNSILTIRNKLQGNSTLNGRQKVIIDLYSGRLNQHGLAELMARIINHINFFMWHVATHRDSSFKLYHVDVITCPCPNHGAGLENRCQSKRPQLYSSNTLFNTIFLSTLLVVKRVYFARSSLVLWLLMPWLIASPGHQQPWHWICRIKG